MEREITIALAGNPNSGKTTIFNNLTGARQHVGNYPGVTVEKKTGETRYKGYKINVVDLPGTYSLTAYSLDEIVARNFVINEKPDVVVDVIDSSNLERNLYLAVQLIELKAPLVFAFNMTDVAKSSGKKIDIKLLSELMGVPIVETIGHKKKGMSGLLDSVIKTVEKRENGKNVVVRYGEEIENEIEKIEKILISNKPLSDKFNLRWLAVKLLEQDREVIQEVKKKLGSSSEYSSIEKAVDDSIAHIKSILRDPPETIIADARYGFINGALQESYEEIHADKTTISDEIDKVITNRILGLPIFAILMWLMFQFVFTIGAYPMKWIDIGFGKLANLAESFIPEGLLQSFVVDGIIGGVGGVLTFTPNIMLLFICIAVLEDSGYMARAAFVTDRMMHKIGLHGKSFIPMLIGFGCTVPAYMAARTIENKRDRLVTMHVTTFMSCGARLPVYILLAGAFFPKYAGNVIFLIYVIGVLTMISMAKLLRSTRFKGEPSPFVMELPPYRIPTFKGVMIHMWERTRLYLKKAGTVILVISVVMWALFTFPIIGDNYSKDYKAEIESQNEAFKSGEVSKEDLEENIAAIKGDMAREEMSYTIASRAGHFIEPVFKPLGFDWKLTVTAMSGIAAKEVVVSTMGTLLSITEADEESGSFRDKLASEYNPLVGLSFMLFILLMFPCMAALTIFRMEAGMKEVLFQIGYTLMIAWVVSLIVYQIGKLIIYFI